MTERGTHRQTPKRSKCRSASRANTERDLTLVATFIRNLIAVVMTQREQSSLKINVILVCC